MRKESVVDVLTPYRNQSRQAGIFRLSFKSVCIINHQPLLSFVP
jgi:hypothetical protein